MFTKEKAIKFVGGVAIVMVALALHQAFIAPQVSKIMAKKIPAGK